jgi:hypothetical protein
LKSIKKEFAPGGCYHPPGLQIVSRTITSSTSKETHAMRLYQKPLPTLSLERREDDLTQPSSTRRGCSSLPCRGGLGRDQFINRFNESNPCSLTKIFYSNLVDKKMKKDNLKEIIWEVTFS